MKLKIIFLFLTLFSLHASSLELEKRASEVLELVDNSIEQNGTVKISLSLEMVVEVFKLGKATQTKLNAICQNADPKELETLIAKGLRHPYPSYSESDEEKVLSVMFLMANASLGHHQDLEKIQKIMNKIYTREMYFEYLKDQYDVEILKKAKLLADVQEFAAVLHICKESSWTFLSKLIYEELSPYSSFDEWELSRWFDIELLSNLGNPKTELERGIKCCIEDHLESLKQKCNQMQEE